MNAAKKEHVILHTNESLIFLRNIRIHEYTKYLHTYAYGIFFIVHKKNYIFKSHGQVRYIFFTPRCFADYKIHN